MIEKSVLNLNDFWRLTKSQKLSRRAYITSMIVERIDNDLNIKRLVLYLTENPLAKKSKDLDGHIIIQKDISDSLQNKVTVEYEEGKKIEFSKSLIRGSFNPNMKIINQCYIFVENYRSYYKHDGIGTLYFAIHIIIPDEYNYIKDSESDIGISRNTAIGCLIDNMFDGYTVDDGKYSDLIGNIKFELTQIEEERVGSNSDGIRLTLVYKTIVWSERCLDDKYI